MQEGKEGGREARQGEERWHDCAPKIALNLLASELDVGEKIVSDLRAAYGAALIQPGREARKVLFPFSFAFVLPLFLPLPPPLPPLHVPLRISPISPILPLFPLSSSFITYYLPLTLFVSLFLTLIFLLPNFYLYFLSSLPSFCLLPPAPYSLSHFSIHSSFIYQRREGEAS